MRKSLFMVLVLLFVSSAGAAVNIYLHMEGIEGDSAVKGREGWMEITRLTHGIVQHQELDSGRTGSGSLEFPGVGFRKRLDRASPELYLASAKGRHFPEVLIDFVRQSEDAVRFYRVRLHDVLLTRVEVSHADAGGELPEEQFVMDFVRIEWTYTEYDAGETKVGDHISDWDRETMTGGYVFVAANEEPPGFSVSLSVSPNGGAATLSWTSVAGKTYGVFYSPTVDGEYQLLKTVASSGADITSTEVEVKGPIAFFHIQEVE